MSATENWASTEALAARRKTECQAEVVRLLNAAQSLLTGWVLKEDTEKVEALFDPIYDLCDKD